MYLCVQQNQFLGVLLSGYLGLAIFSDVEVSDAPRLRLEVKSDWQEACMTNILLGSYSHTTNLIISGQILEKRQNCKRKGL